jgi:hypothetical protein
LDIFKVACYVLVFSFHIFDFSQKRSLSKNFVVLEKEKERKRWAKTPLVETGTK